MSYWLVKWGDISKEFKKTLNPLKERIKAYFEDEQSLYTFVTIGSLTLYSVIPKTEISIEGFKMEFLSSSYELLMNPVPVIKQESQ